MCQHLEFDYLLLKLFIGLRDEHDEIRQLALQKNYINRNYHNHIFTYSNWHRNFYNTLHQVRPYYIIIVKKEKSIVSTLQISFKKNALFQVIAVYFYE